MIRQAIKHARTSGAFGSGFLCSRPIIRSQSMYLSNDVSCSSKANPVALQMINYALSHARSQKSDESYSQGLLILEQCLSTQSNEGDDYVRDNSKGLVLLAISTLLSESGNFEEAIEKLGKIQDLSHASLGVRVTTTEALAGLHLELGLDDTASMLVDICLQLLQNWEGGGYGFEVLIARAKALKGLVALADGDVVTAESIFQGTQSNSCCAGNAALSYGELLHVTRNFSSAKEQYQKVLEAMSRNRDSDETYPLEACNMSSDAVLLAATCALGQLEAHMGNFAGAEEILTRALTKTEEHFGSHHPKVGVVLTCIALMFRQKAMQEHSSALLIQEGLYRRAIEMLKAPPMETEGTKSSTMRRDIAALARGGYAEVLRVQQNRKDEGDRMNGWAESAWRNRRLSLADALDVTETSKLVPVLDTRISRVL